MIETIQVRDGKLVDPVDHRRIMRRDGVEPAAAPWPARRCSEFTSHFVQQVSQLSVFSRQRSFTHSRRIRLHHSQNAVHAMWRYAAARARAASRRLRRSDIRISPMVEVQKSALRTSKKDSLSLLQGTMEVND